MVEAREDRLNSKTIIMLVIAWLWVGIPLGWGIYQTYLKSAALFK